MRTLPYVYLSFLLPVVGVVAAMIGLILCVAALVIRSSDILYLSGVLMFAGCVECYVWYRRVGCPPRNLQKSVSDADLGLFVVGIPIPLYPAWSLISVLMANHDQGAAGLHMLAAPLFSLIEGLLASSLLLALSSGSWALPEERTERLQAVTLSVRALALMVIIVITTIGLLIPLNFGVEVNANWIPVVAIVLALMFSYTYSISKTENMDVDGISRWGKTELLAFGASEALLLFGLTAVLSGSVTLSPELATWMRARPWYREYFAGLLGGSGAASALVGTVLCRIFIGKPKVASSC